MLLGSNMWTLKLVFSSLYFTALCYSCTLKIIEHFKRHSEVSRRKCTANGYPSYFVAIAVCGLIVIKYLLMMNQHTNVLKLHIVCYTYQWVPNWMKESIVFLEIAV